MTAGLILGIAYGIEVQEENDPYVAMAQKALDALEATAVPGTYIVDFIPFRKHAPRSVDVLLTGHRVVKYVPE